MSELTPGTKRFQVKEKTCSHRDPGWKTTYLSHSDKDFETRVTDGSPLRTPDTSTEKTRPFIVVIYQGL